MPEKRMEAASWLRQCCRCAVPATIVVLLAATYARPLGVWFQVVWQDPNASHGLLVPLVSLFIVWRKREYLAAVEKTPTSAGLWLIGVGLLLLLVGRASQIGFFEWVSFLLVLGGLGWHILGSRGMRLLLFPYLFLWFMLPLPAVMVETLTFHLQLLSTKAAVMVAGLLGIGVSREGVEIQMHAYTFQVAAPCSGMRSLAALTALGAVCAYIFKGRPWQRVTLFVLVPPLAVAGNVSRIVLVLLLARQWGREVADGFYHEFSGIVVFTVTFLLLLVTAGFLGMKAIRRDL